MVPTWTIKQAVKGLTPAALHPPAVAARLLKRLQRSDRILAGPFRGMRFVWDVWDDNFTMPIPKFLGTYELELHEVIEKVCRIEPDVVVDVGAADGYYAVGLALRIPRARIVTFEELGKGQLLIRKVAELNNVAKRVTSLGRCDVSDLRQAIDAEKRTFVMTDVEGYERTLLDPELIPKLRDALILVEAHDCYSPGLAEEIRRRFSATHRIEIVNSQVRSLADVHSIGLIRKHYSKHSILGWMGERAFPMSWLFLEPKG